MQTVSDSTDILELCLQAIEQGNATVDQCAARYPEIAGLGEMLHVAIAARNIPRPVMSLVAKKALEQQLIATMSKSRQPQPRRSQPIRQWLRVPVTLAAMLVLLLGTGLGLTRAAENTIPGDALYGVKRVSEQVNLFFADAPARPAVLTHIAESRLTEMSALATQGRSIDAGLMIDTVHSLNAAADAQPDPVKRAALFAQGRRVVELLNTGGQAEQAASLSAALNGVATPTPTPTDAPAMPAPSQTPTPTPTVTPTPEPTETDMPTPTDDSLVTPDDLPTRRGPRRTQTPKPTKDKGGMGNSDDRGNRGNGN
jgi:Domain of unknown function (DUF5667)